MYARIAAAGLRDVADKLDGGVRLDLADGIRLFASPDLLAVGWLANREREKRHGGRTFFNHNIRLEATNVCVASCLFCAFARLQPGDPGAYAMSLEQAWGKLRERAGQPLTEVNVFHVTRILSNPSASSEGIFHVETEPPELDVVRRHLVQHSTASGSTCGLMPAKLIPLMSF